MPIPASVQFIDGSVFAQFNQCSISIEADDEYFTINYQCLIDGMPHTLIHDLSKSPTIEIS
jgi:hypothetical protein